MTTSETTDPPDGAVDCELAHERTRVNGVGLHYVTAGPEDGDLVVLLHGFPEFWYSWRHQIPALVDAGYRVVAPDMRGYNRSEKPDGVDAYHVDELVADAVGLIERLGGTAHLVGHDWGGLVAWYVGAWRPDVLDRLVVLNAPHPTRYEERLRSAPSQVLKSWYVFYFQLPRIPEWGIRRNDYAAIEALFREQTTAGAVTDADLRRYERALDRPRALTAAVNYYRALFRRNAKRTLTGGGLEHLPVDVPAMLLWGDHDWALDVELTEGVEEWVPDLRVERVPDAGHWVQFDASDRVDDALRAFL